MNYCAMFLKKILEWNPEVLLHTTKETNKACSSKTKHTKNTRLSAYCSTSKQDCSDLLRPNAQDHTTTLTTSTKETNWEAS